MKPNKKELISWGRTVPWKGFYTSPSPERQWLLAPACLGHVAAPRKGITDAVCSKDNAPHFPAPSGSGWSPVTFPVQIRGVIPAREVI